MLRSAARSDARLEAWAARSRPPARQRPRRQAVQRDLVVERLARQAEEARGLAAAEAVAPQRVEDPFALAREARAVGGGGGAEMRQVVGIDGGAACDECGVLQHGAQLAQIARP